MLGWLALDLKILLQCSEGELGGWGCPAEGQTVGAGGPPRRLGPAAAAAVAAAVAAAGAAAVAGEHAAVPLGRGGVAAGLGRVPRVAPAVVW